MKYLPNIIYKNALVVVFSMASFAGIAQNDTLGKQQSIVVSNNWIKQLYQVNNNDEKVALLQLLETYLGIDTLPKIQKADAQLIVMNPMFIDLDSDGIVEMIGHFGRNSLNCLLVVCKQFGNQWKIIYTEPVQNFYDEPELYVANNFGNNKTFYTRVLYDRGSGIYQDAFHFYKIINGKVENVLQLINKSHLIGWGSLIDYQIQLQLKINAATKDEIIATYDYRFAPEAIYVDGISLEEYEHIYFIQDKQSIYFEWNPNTLRYEMQEGSDEQSLTKKKYEYFWSYGNSKKFIEAFQFEFNQLKSNGTHQQKRLLKEYLEMIENEN